MKKSISAGNRFYIIWFISEKCNLLGLNRGGSRKFISAEFNFLTRNFYLLTKGGDMYPLHLPCAYGYAKFIRKEANCIVIGVIG